MADFTKAVTTLLQAEGGVSNHPADSQGLTNFGIGLKFLQGEPVALGDVDGNQVIDSQDILALTPERAADLYRAIFWEPLQLARIQDQRLANLVLSLTVNMGIRRGVMLLQAAINELVPSLNLTVDGILGNLTLSSINARNPRALCNTYKALAAHFYHKVATQHPEDLVFLKGWLARLSLL